MALTLLDGRRPDLDVRIQLRERENVLDLMVDDEAMIRCGGNMVVVRWLMVTLLTTIRSVIGDVRY